MNLRCLTVCLLMSGVATAFAAGPPAPSRQKATYDPNDPEKTRPIVSREDREKLGLTPRAWTGVVQPEVHTTLDRLNKTVEGLKERLRLKKGRDLQAFDALERIQFEGMVYVQVQVKDRPAQRRVLASLNASEFHRPFLFENSAGFTGYVTKDGVDKLAKSPDVVGVCLDDKPLPERPKPLYKNDLPPAGPGDASATKPGVAEMKVDPDVYRAFDVSDRVFVIVSLHAKSIPPGTDVPSEMWTRGEMVDKAAKQLQDRVLSTLSAEEFWLSTREHGGAGFCGFISKEGFDKLRRHAEVQRIYLDELHVHMGTVGKDRSPGTLSKERRESHVR
jgi:hypothetical protein